MPTFNYNVSISNVLKIANAHADGYKKGATRAAKNATDVIKNVMRSHIRSSLGGRGRFQNTLRSVSFPKPPRISAAPAIWTYSTASDIMHSLDRGSIVRARNGAYLAIPVDRLRRRRFGRRSITPKNWHMVPGNRGRELVPVEKGGRAYLFDSKDGDLEFTLIPSVAIPKKLALNANYRKALRMVNDLAILNISDGIIDEARLVNDRPE